MRTTNKAQTGPSELDSPNQRPTFLPCPNRWQRSQTTQSKAAPRGTTIRTVFTAGVPFQTIVMPRILLARPRWYSLAQRWRISRSRPTERSSKSRTPPLRAPFRWLASRSPWCPSSPVPCSQAPFLGEGRTSMWGISSTFMKSKCRDYLKMERSTMSIRIT